MLAELFDRIVRLGRDAESVSLHSIEADPRVVLVRHGSELETRSLPPPLRDATLQGLDDVVSFIGSSGRAPRPELYYSDAGVRVLLDAEDRREQATLALAESARFDLLRELTTPKSFGQREAVKFLRYRLAGTNVDHVVSALRQIDFSRRSSGAGTVEHGKESLGRSVEAAVQQADRIPDAFEVTTPVWTNPGLRQITATVTVGLYLDLEKPAIELGVLPDEIESALCTALEELRRLLAERLPEVPLFHGAP